MRAIPIPPTRLCLPRVRRAENKSSSPMAAPNHSGKTRLRLNPHSNKTQPIGPTHIGAGGERSIKKSNSEPRQNHTGILTSDSCSSKLRFKHRSSDHVNENGSPVSNVHASIPQIKRAARKRKVKFEIESDSSEYGSGLSKGDTSTPITTNSRHYKI